MRDKKRATRKPRAVVGKESGRKLPRKRQRAVKAALETTRLCSNARRRGKAGPGTFVPRVQDEDFRLDPIRNARRAMTCCTSVWGDGSGGPLGITVPEGMLTAKFIAQMNRERQGKVYIMTSGSNTHFMNAETTVELLEKLFIPAFKRQRQKHNLAHAVPGILQCDAFSGNFADSSGEHLRRSLLFDEMNVLPPDRQPGGWSAKGQAADKINGHFKRRSDAYTNAVLGFNHDRSTGTLARKIAPEEAVLNTAQIADDFANTLQIKLQLFKNVSELMQAFSKLSHLSLDS